MWFCQIVLSASWRRSFRTGSCGSRAANAGYLARAALACPDQPSAGMNFSEMDVARAHLIRDLKADFGANDEGVDVILHLVDQLHGLRRALAQLNRDLQGTSR